jgi:hypothetical protein
MNYPSSEAITGILTAVFLAMVSVCHAQEVFPGRNLPSKAISVHRHNDWDVSQDAGRRLVFAWLATSLCQMGTYSDRRRQDAHNGGGNGESWL